MSPGERETIAVRPQYQALVPRLWRTDPRRSGSANNPRSLGCPRFPCLRVVNSEFANHPSIFWRQQSTNSQIPTSDVLCRRCATQICGFADVNKNKHSPRCAAAAATNFAAAPKKRRPRPRPRYHTPPSSGDKFGHAIAVISMVSVSENWHGREGLSIIRGERGSRPPREKPTRGFVPSLQLASFPEFCKSVRNCDFANLWIVGAKKKLANSQVYNLQKRTSGTPYCRPQCNNQLRKSSGKN